jgi:glutamate/tyrosine decarboxylase-like PLP-dependent enzyme
LKVWLALQQIGRSGYVKLIGEDIALARSFHDLAEQHAELEAGTHNLSITTMRYIPKDLASTGDERDGYLDTLNEALVNELQQGGELFLSNAIVSGRYHLRACIVNFRTTQKDIEESIGIIVRTGRRTHQALQDKARKEA